MDCIFCKIINGEMPSDIIYEDDKYMAFLDIMPVSRGHALLVPKEHNALLHEITDEMLSGIMIISKKIIPLIIKAVNADGYNIGINNGTAAGQVVNHLHIHIIPRFKNDGLSLWPKIHITDKERHEIAQAIKNEFNK